MTVRELLELLKDANPDTVVLVYNNDDWEPLSKETIEISTATQATDMSGAPCWLRDWGPKAKPAVWIG